MDEGNNTKGNDNDRCRKHANYWNIRNNSSSVSAILNSELHNSEYESSFLLNTLRKSVVVSDHCYKDDKNPKFRCEDCYCRKSPVYPKLNMKLAEQSFDNLKLPKCRRINYMYGCQNSCDHCCSITPTENSYLFQNKEATGNSYSGYTPESTFLKHFCCTCQEGTKSNKVLGTPCLQYTTPRKTYELFKTPLEFQQNYVNGVVKCKHVDKKKFKEIEGNLEKPIEKDTYKTKNFKFQKRDNRLSPLTSISENEEQEALTSATITHEISSKPVIFNSNASTDVCLKKLNTFRKENYFDCHSAGNFDDTKMEDHKCIHKFVLNERLIPQPLNVDSFGTSRCVICNRTSKSGNFRKDVTKGKTDYQTNTLKTLKRRSDCNIENKINIAAKNERIEITVPFPLDKSIDLFDTNVKIKNPVPASSLALRHQKGVI